MTRKINPGPALNPVRDTGATLPRIDPRQVQKALGAEESGEGIAGVFGSLSLATLRQELVKRLRSTGGRPALSGTTRRAKIPLNDREWAKLEELAAAVASEGFAPSPGQIAGLLLSLSLRAVVSS
jgi:hypothetical protein